MTINHESGLLERNAPANPFALFAQWYLDAEAAELTEPSAMTLATVDAQGTPHARMVLMRGFDDRGFMFFTNYTSNKAEQLAANPKAALVLYWGPLERQIRIEGNVEKISAAESDAYFRKRPLGHQLGAWASPQSQVIPNRAYLEERLAVMQAQFAETEALPRPEYWGGYRVVPQSIEFWQGGENRLHDRLRYRRIGNGWIIERLAP
jgi:pyridoxamine 5'-phosphate oxidase